MGLSRSLVEQEVDPGFGERRRGDGIEAKMTWRMGVRGILGNAVNALYRGGGQGFPGRADGRGEWALVEAAVHAAHLTVCGGARSRSRAAEMRSTKCIAPPQLGQRHSGCF